MIYINFIAIFLSIFLSLIKLYSTQICNILSVKLNVKPLSQEVVKLRSELKTLQKKLDSINAIDEFAQYALTQRQINKINDQIDKETKDNRTDHVKLLFYIKAFYYAIIAILTLIMVYLYRYTPIIDFNGCLNDSSQLIFYPLDSIISFPSKSPNSIGFPFWLFLVNRAISIFHVKNKI